MASTQLVVKRPVTKSDESNLWDFKGCNTQHGVHGIHTYVAAMIPQLAERLINEFAPSGGLIFDPFCGGGAVLAEAVRGNRRAIGRDINKLAVLISKVKTTYVPEAKSNAALKHILANVDIPNELPEIDSKIAYWFKTEHLPLLYGLRNAISRTVEPASPMLPLFLVAFSATVRDVSLTYRNEIRLRRMSPEEIDRFQVDPIERFQARAEYTMKAVSDLPATAQGNVAIGDVRSIDLPDKSVSTIVCSPPYGDERNGVSYTQFSKNMLAMIGYSAESTKQSKSLSLGWGKQDRSIPESQTLISALDKIKDYPDQVREAIAFYADYQVALAEMARVTQEKIIIVIGRRVLRDTIFDNGAITIDLMENLGVPLIHRYLRNLPTKRLPKMRKFGAAINQEDILVFGS